MTPPRKLVSHNVLLGEAEGGKVAFERARDMGVSMVRYDFRWRKLDTGGGWAWDDPGHEGWNGRLEPALRWTKEMGMRTMVNLLAYKAPSHHRNALRAKWEEMDVEGVPDDRDLALFAAWAAGSGVDLGVPTPKDFTEALVDRLADGQGAGVFDIEAFCILNEPNTFEPAEDNWRVLHLPPDHEYSTATFCTDLCRWVKDRIRDRHRDALGHTVNVVNLYSSFGHWRSGEWRSLADDPDMDVLGIDIYWDQWLGLFSICMPWRMGRISREVGKPWWLVETAGAYGLGGFIKTPSCRRVRRNAERCRRHGAEVLGFYRLWGDYRGLLEPASDYNIFTEPGDDPRATEDGRGRRYWETIRDL